MDAILALENGSWWRGKAMGAEGEAAIKEAVRGKEGFKLKLSPFD